MHDMHQSTRTAYFLYNVSPHTSSVLTKRQDTPISIMCQQASNHVSHFPSVRVKFQNTRSNQIMQPSNDFLLTFPTHKPRVVSLPKPRYHVDVTWVTKKHVY